MPFSSAVASEALKAEANSPFAVYRVADDFTIKLGDMHKDVEPVIGPDERHVIEFMQEQVERWQYHQNPDILVDYNLQNDEVCAIRIRNDEWEIQNGNLMLHSKLVVGWEGGELVQNTGIGSYASERVLLNPTVVVYTLVQDFYVPLSEITADSGNGRDTVLFNQLQCWDFSDQGDSVMEDFWQSFMSTWNRAPEPKTKSLPASGLQ